MKKNTVDDHVSNSSGCRQESSARGSHKTALLAVIYTRYVKFSKTRDGTSPQQCAHGYSGALTPTFLGSQCFDRFLWNCVWEVTSQNTKYFVLFSQLIRL